MYRFFACGVLTTVMLFAGTQVTDESEPVKDSAVISQLDTSVISDHTDTLEGDAASTYGELFVAGGTTTKNVSCRTSPTNSSGRKSCNDYASNTLPKGYYYDVNSAETHKSVDIGTSNWIKVTFHDYVEIPGIPGAYVPRTMRVQAHARSGHGYGERGKTSGWGRAKYKKLPE